MKKNFLNLLVSRKLFFRIIFSLLLITVLSLIFIGRTFITVPSNTYHPFWLNVFFINYTFMGNGLFVICIAALFIFRYKRKQQGITLLYGFLLSDFIVQLLKNIHSLAHPTIYLEQGQNLFFSYNNSLSAHNSFISGHTATAFTLATVMMLVLNNSKWQLPLLIAALLLGYSRMYLAQNDLSEIMIAGMVGTVSGIAAVYSTFYFKGVGYYLKKIFNLHNNGAISEERNIQSI